MTPEMFGGADAYDRLMGRYLPTLAPAFADYAGIARGQSVLDVGCGPGGLTRELATRVGAARVTALDPSSSFVVACRERVPGATVLEGVAESLPFEADRFDASLSSLAVGFMTDPEQGVREMTRVTRPGGVLALCFWDVSRMQALSRFWSAAERTLGRSAPDRDMVGRNEGDLTALLADAGVGEVEASTIEASGHYADFEDLWSGYAAGIGPIGQFMVTLDPGQQTAVRSTVRAELDLPEGSFTLPAIAWVARGTVAG